MSDGERMTSEIKTFGHCDRLQRYLVLDYLSWIELELYACICSKSLHLIQCYLLDKPKRVNHLSVLLRLFPDEKWNHAYLCSNPSLTWDLLQYHQAQVKWNDEWFSYNSSVTWDFVTAHPEIKWDYGWLSSNPNITYDIVEAHSDKRWEGLWLNLNPNITPDIIKRYRQRWLCHILSIITPQIVAALGLCPNVRWDIIRSHPEIKWEGCDVTGEPEQNLVWRWNYYMLRNNPNVSWEISEPHTNRTGLEIIQAHPEIKWDEFNLSIHPLITWDLVRAHPELNWNYDILTLNNNITWDIVCAHPEVRWNYSLLGANKNITFDIVFAHPEIEWDGYWLSHNPNLTWKIVTQHPEIEWHFDQISHNHFGD